MDCLRWIGRISNSKLCCLNANLNYDWNYLYQQWSRVSGSVSACYLIYCLSSSSLTFSGIGLWYYTRNWSKIKSYLCF